MTPVLIPRAIVMSSKGRTQYKDLKDESKGDITMKKNHCKKIIKSACAEAGIVGASLTCSKKRARKHIETIQAEMIVKLGKVYGVHYSNQDAIVKAHSLLARTVGTALSNTLKPLVPSEIRPVLNGSTAALITGITGRLVVAELSLQHSPNQTNSYV